MIVVELLSGLSSRAIAFASIYIYIRQVHSSKMSRCRSSEIEKLKFGRLGRANCASVGEKPRASDARSAGLSIERHYRLSR